MPISIGKAPIPFIMDISFTVKIKTSLSLQWAMSDEIVNSIGFVTPCWCVG